MQRNVIHLQVVAHGHSTPESITGSTLSDELAHVVEAYAEQQ